MIGGRGVRIGQPWIRSRRRREKSKAGGRCCHARGAGDGPSDSSAEGLSGGCRAGIKVV